MPIRSRDLAAGEGDDRNRTGVDGFAGRCVATPPRRQEGSTAYRAQAEARYELLLRSLSTLTGFLSACRAGRRTMALPEELEVICETSSCTHIAGGSGRR